MEKRVDPQAIERRAVPQAMSNVGVESRAEGDERITGLAAVFHREGEPGTEYKLYDDFVERIMPGAFDRAIRERDDCRALFNHDPDHVLGRTEAGTLMLSIDARGLRYEIIPPDTQLARDLKTSIRRRDITGSSFAFTIEEQVFREIGDILYREIVSVRLWDVAPVTFPAYESTTTEISQRSLDRLAQFRSNRPRPQAERLRRRLKLLDLSSR